MKIERIEIEYAENGFILYARWQDLTMRYVARDWDEARAILHTVEWVKPSVQTNGYPTGVPVATERVR